MAPRRALEANRPKDYKFSTRPKLAKVYREL